MKSLLKTNISRNAIAVFTGFFISVLMVIIIDKTFGWSLNIKVSKSDFFPRIDDINGLGWGPGIGNQKKLKKNADGYSITYEKLVNDEVIFNVTYNFDKLYRRRVPGSVSNNADEFIIFLGGSQTFGEGLNDKDTIPALVQTNTASHRVYNYAYRGYGPHQILRLLETRILRDEISEKRGIAFFQYFSFHVPRVVGTMSYIGWAGGGAPYYHINSKDQLEYSGAFATGRFFRTLLYWVLSRSAIAKYYRVDLPANLTHRHFDLICRVIVQSRNEFLDQYPDSRFVVIIGMTSGKSDTIAEECLVPNNMEYVDMRSDYTNDADLQFPDDRHFTPKAAQLIAKRLMPVVNK
jgi:hypothetical protein